MSVKPAGARANWEPLLSGLGYIGISLHSGNHSGGALVEIVDWINEKTRFDTVRIGLSDVLNRHTYRLDGLAEVSAQQKAQAHGDLWLFQNEGAIAKLKMPFELIRWGHWLETKADQVRENKIRFSAAFQTNEVFRAAVVEDMDRFFKRRGGTVSSDFARAQHSVNYLVEELAVYEEIFRGYPCTTVYPGRQLACFEVLRSGRVEGLSETIPATSFVRLNVNVTKDNISAPIMLRA